MTRIFGPYVSVTRGIDVSRGMVAAYNSRVEAAGLSGESVRAVQGDLFDDGDASGEESSGREWCGFDIVAVGFGFHHFPDVVRSARRLKERLRPGGVLVVSDFVEGGDVLADEKGEAVQGSEGNHAVHSHGHGHGHGHSHEHHAHHHDGKEDKMHGVDESSPELEKKMAESVVVPHFSVQGVKDFFTEAGFVDVDVITMDERVYMEFAGKKLWRTILFARGRRPFESGERSEL
ncbi:S-adenosyl-L-methionine-dependent methyltransferase [Ampelomyces quisqualis]|uniref:S-adenosyl-L-methionine-dependent methyltransferase n=1 Tax=Ampelomyces quisqualis TaxID=50730 RepID=A0A6A5QPK9_AMPQU|nr:S-adenosyl-L-methionine-dependent methyltransferase [Ampelomyces quisqualis]